MTNADSQRGLRFPSTEGRYDYAGVGRAEITESPTEDELYQLALKIVREAGRASACTLQRRLKIGYGRACHLIDMMKLRGIVLLNGDIRK